MGDEQLTLSVPLYGEDKEVQTIGAITWMFEWMPLDAPAQARVLSYLMDRAQCAMVRGLPAAGALRPSSEVGGKEST